MNRINDYTDPANHQLIDCIICFNDQVASTRKHKPVDGIDLGEIHRICDTCLPLLQQWGSVCPYNCGATFSLRGRVTNQDQEAFGMIQAFANLQIIQVQEQSETELWHEAAKKRAPMTDAERQDALPTRKKLEF